MVKEKELSWNTREKWEWYMAALITELQRSFVSAEDAIKLTVAGNLIDFVFGKNKKVKNAKSKKQKFEDKLARSKSYWFGIVGLDNEGNSLPPPQKPLKVKRKN